MKQATFITGNDQKAALFAEYMGQNIPHKKLDLDEIQSLDLKEVVEHKVKQAFQITNGPVLVEDVALELTALNGLPGPFVKWFEQALGLENICRLLDNYQDRSAKVKICFGYFDGKSLRFFEGEVKGKISNEVREGPSNFGWNPIFISDGSSKTYAESGENFREATVFPQIKEFLLKS